MSPPTAVPSKSPVFSLYTEREIDFYSCSHQPYDIAFLLNGNLPLPSPVPMRAPIKLGVASVGSAAAEGEGALEELLAAALRPHALDTVAAYSSSAPLSGNGDGSHSYMGFFDQVMATRLGYPGPGVPRPTKLYLDIRMAATGWGNQDGGNGCGCASLGGCGCSGGQYITFYASLDNAPNKIVCTAQAAITDPQCTRPNFDQSWAPCTGKLVAIYYYYPSFDPAQPHCSSSPDESLEVAVNVDVTQVCCLYLIHGPFAII